MVVRRNPLFSFILVLVALSATLSAQQATVIVGKNGTEKEERNIRITKDSYTGVTGKRSSASFSWKPAQVKRIEWRVAPENYKKGMSAYRDGAYEKAAQLFTEVLKKPDNYPWLPVYGNFHLARSLARIGYAQNALDAYAAVLKADSKHRFVPDVYAERADILLSPAGGRNLGLARAEFKKLDGIARTIDGRLSDDSYLIKSELGVARILIETKKAPEAISILDGLAKRARGRKGLLNLISMVKGRALVSLGQFNNAEKSFKAILDDKSITSPEVIAGAANGLGDCEFEQDKFEKAMWTYSRTYALFHDRDDLKRQVAWALYRGGMAFRRQAGKLQGDDRKKLYRYGTKTLRRAAKEFKGTNGGRKAAETLGLATGK
ncbi:MAG: hypothetical protein CMJ83_12750 [Planctomycetes bacterium]|nr:hypothetical protein [Planctomycetota bacterium]